MFDVRWEVIKKRKLEHCGCKADHIRNLDEVVMDDMPVHGPQASDQHRGQDQVKGQGFRTFGPEHMLNTGERGATVSYGHGGSHQANPKLRRGKIFLVINVHLHQCHNYQC